MVLERLILDIGKKRGVLYCDGRTDATGNVYMFKYRLLED